MKVTLSRGSNSIDILTVENGSGQPLVSCDISKPELDVHSVGDVEPRTMDNWSGVEQYTILGRLNNKTNGDAYQTAADLADMIKEPNGGDPLYLDIPLGEYPSQIEVCPSAGSNEAVNMVYRPGRKNWVDVDLGLTRVESTLGNISQNVSTPTATGAGPIQLAHNGQTVNLEKGIEVSRTVGRPNSTAMRSTGQNMRYIDKPKSAYDAFELSLTFGQNTVGKVSRLRDMTKQKLRRDTMELRFNGVYGLGTFDVVPVGSNAVRHVRRSGYQGVTVVPTLNLRVAQPT